MKGSRGFPEGIHDEANLPQLLVVQDVPPTAGGMTAENISMISVARQVTARRWQRIFTDLHDSQAGARYPSKMKAGFIMLL